jgi:hypothetical protein
MTVMRASLVRAVGLLLIGGGCFGGSSSSAPPRPSGYRLCTHRELQTKTFKSTCAYRTASGAWKVVQVSPAQVGGIVWTVVYPVGNVARTRAGAPPCPTGATCRVILNRDVTYSDGKHAWATLATRTLTCPDGGGDYPDPARACRALIRLRAILRIKPRIVCSCPAMLSPPGKATATINGKHVTVPLDVCTYCGRSTHTTSADLNYLQLQPRR